MEYFTLAEELEEVKRTKIRFTKRFLLFPLILLLFLLLRGMGFITIEYNKVFLNGNHQIHKNIYEENLKQNRANQETKNSNIETTDKDSYWEWAFKLRGNFINSQDEISNYPSDENEYLEELIKQKISKENSLSKQFEFTEISVKKFEMSGFYWFPIIKSGKSSYVINIQNNFNQNTYSADFSGEINLEVYGLCTIDKLEKIVSEKIAKIVVESIENDYKK